MHLIYQMSADNLPNRNLTVETKPPKRPAGKDHPHNSTSPLVNPPSPHVTAPHVSTYLPSGRDVIYELPLRFTVMVRVDRASVEILTLDVL